MVENTDFLRTSGDPTNPSALPCNTFWCILTLSPALQTLI